MLSIMNFMNQFTNLFNSALNSANIVVEHKTSWPCLSMVETGNGIKATYDVTTMSPEAIQTSIDGGFLNVRIHKKDEVFTSCPKDGFSTSKKDQQTLRNEYLKDDHRSDDRMNRFSDRNTGFESGSFGKGHVGFGSMEEKYEEKFRLPFGGSNIQLSRHVENGKLIVEACAPDNAAASSQDSRAGVNIGSGRREFKKSYGGHEKYESKTFSGSISFD